MKANACRVPLVVVASVLFPLLACAQAPAPWPNKPIRLIVPFAPGGGSDFLARVLGRHLTDRLGQQVVIENRAGADGIVGLTALKASAPDGYTISIASIGPLAVNPNIYRKIAYDPLRDFDPVAKMVNQPLLLVVHPSLPVKNVRELVALAQARPNQLSYSSSGAGSAANLAGELFNAMARVQITHIPYKGTGPAVIDTISGQVQLTYGATAVSPFVRNGKLRALGVGDARRVPNLPDIPTIAESGVPGYEAYAWSGVVAPANLPKDVLGRLSREIVQMVQQKDVADLLLQQGNVPMPLGPEEFAAYIKAEMAKWGAVVRMANIRVD
jgi:tripartite-type tricarboxylate transporter receptor subunit TctC